MTTPADIAALIDALEKMIDAEVDLRIAPAELKQSRKSGVQAYRTDLERCLRRVCGLSGSTSRMGAVKLPGEGGEPEPDPFKK